MKKVIFAFAACALLLGSCGSIHRTSATTVSVANSVAAVALADLEVGPRVTYVYTTTGEDRTGGIENCKRAAVAALLKANGNADVLVAPEYSYKGDMKSIEVSGRPAKYANFRSAQ